MQVLSSSHSYVLSRIFDKLIMKTGFTEYLAKDPFKFFMNISTFV